MVNNTIWLSKRELRKFIREIIESAKSKSYLPYREHKKDNLRIFIEDKALENMLKSHTHKLFKKGK